MLFKDIENLGLQRQESKTDKISKMQSSKNNSDNDSWVA